MKASQKNIITLTNTAFAKVVDARVSRWELGQALLAEFYCKVAGEIVSKKSQDSDAMTVAEFAKDNHKALGKSVDALKVFYSEAIKFAKKHNTVESAKKDTIKGKKVESKVTRFSATKKADSTINTLGEDKARKLALAILAKVGK